MSHRPSGKGDKGAKGDKEKNPLELPEGINKRCDLPPEAYWVTCGPKPASYNANLSFSTPTASTLPLPPVLGTTRHARTSRSA